MVEVIFTVSGIPGLHQPASFSTIPKRISHALIDSTIHPRFGSCSLLLASDLENYEMKRKLMQKQQQQNE
jgi:hypothetical protein